MKIKRCYDTLVGASVAENQLCNSESVTVTNGHKYYLKKSGTESLGTSTGTAITGLTSGSDMVIDLTQKLGSSIADYIYSLETATAGAGIAKLREWGFLRGYQAYNAGSLESVEVTEKKCVGFNQWDEEWEKGTIDNDTGQPVSSPINLRSKNFIPIMPDTTYYGLLTPNMWMTRFYYDENYNYLAPTQSSVNGTFVTPSNARYMKFRTEASKYPLPYNHDICINLSNPDRNGEYEAYASQTYDYGDDVLNGIFKLDSNNRLYADGDTKASDGTVTRKYGIVDLGTLNWYYTSGNDFFYTGSGAGSGALSDRKSGSTNFICSSYNNIGNAYDATMKTAETGSIAGGAGSTQIKVKNTAYTDAATFKTAMSGVMLVYELATPTTEQGDPFTSPQIVYPDGTEEFVTENGVPVGHETKYQL